MDLGRAFKAVLTIGVLAIVASVAGIGMVLAQGHGASQSQAGAAGHGAAIDASLSCSGPQSPRDITSKAGNLMPAWKLAPDAKQMNLCNIHFHEAAEHKGPGFSEAAAHGGFKCNGSTPSTSGKSVCAPSAETMQKASAKPGQHVPQPVRVGDTIEVHWVFTSCPVTSMTNQLADCQRCANPVLRVESQVLLVADNDSTALDFNDFDLKAVPSGGYLQPKTLPRASADAVVFRGSTTGGTWDAKCSPAQVTWQVRPTCAKVNIDTLGSWCAANVYNETHGHDVRKLVTSPAALESIGGKAESKPKGLGPGVAPQGGSRARSGTVKAQAP